MRLKGIKPVTVTKGDGRTYHYFYHRATGKRIAAAPDTAAFIEEVAKLDAKARADAPRDGSLHALIVAYRSAPEWTQLRPRTQRDYQKVFDHLHPIREMALIEISTPFVYGLRDEAFKMRKRRFANYVVQVVRLLLEWGKRHGHLTTNPAVEVEKIRRPKNLKKANRAWSDKERETVLGEAPIFLRAVIGLGMFAGLREGDAVSVPLSAYDGKLVEAIAAKNGEPLWIPAHYRLRGILSEAATARHAARVRRSKRRKVVPIDPPSLAVSSRGTAWTEAGLRASFFALIRKLQQAGRVKPGLTFHGLRHTVGKLVIEAGGSKTDVGFLLGDRSEAMAALYSQEHEKRQRVSAIIQKMERVEKRRLAEK